MKSPTLDDEQRIAAWQGITLTTHRVVHRWTTNGQEQVDSLLLHRVDHTALKGTTSVGALAVALLLGVLTLFLVLTQAGTLPAFTGFAAVVALLYFLFSRRIEARVGAGGGLIRCQLAGGSARAREALAFLAKVDEAAVMARSAPTYPRRVDAESLVAGPSPGRGESDGRPTRTA